MDTIELKNVSKDIGSARIIKNVSINIKKGEIFGLLGPNGAGKTTLIRMIVSLTRTTTGSIKICGVDIHKNRNEAMKHIGGIVENPELYNYMTGYANLKHYANMHPNIPEKRIYEVAKLVKLEKNLKQKVKTYSLGMKQRLGVAQALLHNPSVLILDEPINGLDPEGIKEFREYIKDFAINNQMSILISSHMLNEIELTCDRIGIIKEGSLIEVKDLKNKVTAENQRYQIKVDVTSAARELLKEFSEIFQVLSSDTIEIYVKEENIPNILNAFHLHHIKVYEIRKITDTLEDQYFEAIAGLEN